MSTTVGYFTTHWTDLLAYGLVEYVSDFLLAPVASRSTIGYYLTQGVVFGSKQAVANTHPLSNLKLNMG